jgi:hypothetical protein
VVGALRRLGPSSLATLVTSVYDDVHEGLHPIAERSLTAHLLKLRVDGRASEDGGRWSLTA